MYRAVALPLEEPDAAGVVDRAVAFVAAAESQGLDFVLVGTGPEGLALEPLMLGAALAAATTRIGLVIETPLAKVQPYNVARRLASVDLISHGRCGWAVSAPAGLSPKDEEILTVVSGLWDSWEDGAFVHDKASARMFRPEKLHRLEHRGAFFSVRGPLNVGRSIQGRPPILMALEPGAPAETMAWADIVLAEEQSVEAMRQRGARPLFAIVEGTASDIERRAEGLVREACVDGILARPRDTEGLMAFVQACGATPSRHDGPVSLRDRLGLQPPRAVVAGRAGR